MGFGKKIVLKRSNRVSETRKAKQFFVVVLLFVSMMVITLSTFFVITSILE